MGDSFKTAIIAEQLDLLKSKGLIISNYEDAFNYLLRRSFYEMANNYAPFFLDSDGLFVSNASFQEISYVQLFDREIGNILFKAIMEIQHTFQSLIGNLFTECHSENNAFLKNENFSSNTTNVAKLMNLLSDIMNQSIKTKDKAVNALNAEQYALGALLHQLSFQQTIQFYSCLQEKDQHKTTEYFSVQLSKALGKTTEITPMQIISYLTNLQELKNYITDGSTLLNHQCQKNSEYLPDLHCYYNITPSDDRRDVYNCFITMRIFLTENQFALVSNSLRKRFKQLFRIIKSIDPNTITHTLGFPNNWHNAICLPQNNRDKTDIINNKGNKAKIIR